MQLADFLFDGASGEVSDARLQSRQRVKERALSGVRVADHREAAD